MKCQRCGNNATTHFIQNINGQTEELWLCSDCAEELGIGGMFTGFEGFGTFDPFDMFGHSDLIENMLSSFFGSFGAGMPAAGIGGKAVKAPDRCPLCGSTFDDIVKRGKAGCPECYEHFADQLYPSIERLHGTGQHSALPGKTAAPGITDATGAADGSARGGRRNAVIPPAESGGTDGSGLASLRAKLERAVADEDYEKAAELHKKIKELEAQ